MKRVIKRNLLYIIMVMFLTGMIKSLVYAAPEQVILTHTNENGVSVYVRGAENPQDITGQIGTAACETVTAEAVREREHPIQTLILLDNSLSIGKDDFARAKELIREIVAERKSGESFRLASFSEEIHYLTEYTDDYITLKGAVDALESADQETYLTDVLYDLLAQEFAEEKEDLFRRILIISDGVDNKSLGYTKEELYALIKEKPYPIYTFGCKHKRNEAELESMFALSRMTGAQSFVLAEASTEEILNTLAADRSIVCFRLEAPEQMRDGSVKLAAVSYQDTDGPVTVQADVRLPLTEAQTLSTKEEAEETQSTEPALEETQMQTQTPEETQEDGFSPRFLIIPAAVLAVLAAVCIAAVFVRRAKKKQEFVVREDAAPPAGQSIAREQTEVIAKDQTRKQEGKTQMLWEDARQTYAVFTDMENPSRTFQKVIDTVLVIGRKAEQADLVIEYDKSVSGRHCEILRRGNRFYVNDAGSANGTYVNGKRILSETEIVSGNILKLGRLELKIEFR